ncbi:anti-sigma factor domain-containing protein [Stackebrandtia soli]|uniref:anti-sigma factor n=1 Tax=Stackebrandtia soli TaxID=1892856 RepID=UPI0039EC2456
MTTQIHTLIGAYALNAVTDEERRLVERHVRDCESCAVELREFAATAARLADYTMVRPPARLRADVMAAVRRVRQRPPRSPSPDILRPRLIRRWRTAIVTTAVAVVVAIASMLVTLVVVEPTPPSATDAMTAVLTAEDARFTAQDVDGGGRVSMVMSRDRDQAVVILTALPAIADTHAYQLWLVDDRGQVSAGVIAAGVNSTAHVVDGLGDAVLLGVTVEPAGGSRTPTLPMVADLAMPE